MYVDAGSFYRPVFLRNLHGLHSAVQQERGPDLADEAVAELLQPGEPLLPGPPRLLRPLHAQGTRLYYKFSLSKKIKCNHNLSKKYEIRYFLLQF